MCACCVAASVFAVVELQMSSVGVILSLGEVAVFGTHSLLSIRVVFCAVCSLFLCNIRTHTTNANTQRFWVLSSHSLYASAGRIISHRNASFRSA